MYKDYLVLGGAGLVGTQVVRHIVRSLQPRRIVVCSLKTEEAEEETFNDGGQVLLPTERRPTLQEYKAKWAVLLAEPSRAIEGNFSAENRCPKPIHQLWNDCRGLELK